MQLKSASHQDGSYTTISLQNGLTTQLVTTLELAIHVPQANYSNRYTVVCKDVMSVQCYVCTDKLSGNCLVTEHYREP